MATVMHSVFYNGNFPSYFLARKLSGLILSVQQVIHVSIIMDYCKILISLVYFLYVCCVMCRFIRHVDQVNIHSTARMFFFSFSLFLFYILCLSITVVYITALHVYQVTHKKSPKTLALSYKKAEVKQNKYIFSVSKHSLICKQKSMLKFLILAEILCKVCYTSKCRKHKVISSLNKRSTENILNWCPSYFVTAAVLPDDFSTAKSGRTFERSS